MSEPHPEKPVVTVTDAQLVTALADLAESQPETKRAGHLVGPAREFVKRLRGQGVERGRGEESEAPHGVTAPGLTQP